MSDDLRPATVIFLQSLGYSRWEAVDEAERLTARAEDMAWPGLYTPIDVWRDILSALMGEWEPIRRWSVRLDSVTVWTKAVEMGLAESEQVSKVKATLALIYEQTEQFRKVTP